MASLEKPEYLAIESCKKYLIKPRFFLKNRSDLWFVEPKQTHNLINVIKSQFLQQDTFFRYTFNPRSRSYDEILRFDVYMDKPARDFQLAYNMLAATTIGLLPIVDRKNLKYKVERLVDGDVKAALVIENARVDTAGMLTDGGMNARPIQNYRGSIDDFLVMFMQQIKIEECS